jgi:hypothetical protein
MSEKKINIKKQNGINSSLISNKNDEINKDEEFEIPFEAACSPEFAQGCIVREDNELEKR